MAWWSAGVYKRKSTADCGMVYVLMLLAVLVGKLIKMGTDDIGERNTAGWRWNTWKIESNWLKVLPAKFAGDFFVCSADCLQAGRYPSIQLGVMSDRTKSRILSRENRRTVFDDVWGERRTGCGIFTPSLWQALCLRWKNCTKGFRQVCFISVMTASVTADYISSHIMGLDPVFDFIGTDASPELLDDPCVGVI